MANALSFLDQSADVHLLVEDWRTHYYLHRLFPVPPFTIQIVPVGGCDGVTRLVKSSWEDDTAVPVRAVGWRDRDFGTDNRAKWQNRDVHVFCATCHEIENYLLDWDALANCTAARGCDLSGDDFRDRCLTKATDMLYDVACGDVLAKLQVVYGDGFPKHPQKRKPKVHVSTLQEAESLITSDVWLQGREAICHQIFDQNNLKSLLGQSVQDFQSALQSAEDDWKVVFPGKEIFETVMQDVYHGTPSLDNMVKSIGEYQEAKGTIPQELQDFMKELARRKNVGWL